MTAVFLELELHTKSPAVREPEIKNHDACTEVK